MPPVNVPDPFLIQMFGPDAPAAVPHPAMRRNDKTLQGLFSLFGSTERTIPFFKIQGDFAVALDDDQGVRARAALRPIPHPAAEDKAVSDHAGQHDERPGDEDFSS